MEQKPVPSPSLEPDFASNQDDDSSLHAAGVDGAEEADTAYSPPIDPVITLGTRGEVQVLGGFSGSSMDSITVAPSSDGTLGDEAIADAIRRELREDAATTDLRIAVTVREGVANLRGGVTDVMDAENAEEVASRVPGVMEVIEDLTIEAV